jgi:arginine/lysine/ornithine decarboxylase
LPSFDQQETPLVRALKACVNRVHAPFYTPGHKRGQGAPERLKALLGSQMWRVDLPELPDLDNLFAPQAAIQQAQELAAEAFGADRTWFLVNGSTSGVIAAILATCSPGDKIILPRNCHQSVISGLVLSGAVPVFVNPAYDPQLDLAHSLTPSAVAAALQRHPDAKAMMLVYPTYYGVCGDIAAIAHLAHQHGIPLLVDEAHGPHFAFHADLPLAALAAGADLVVQSTHKVLSALTQAAMVHLQGDRIEPERVSKALQLVQSSSPSYLLLASLDAARWQMATQGQTLLERTLTLADQARSQLSQIADLSVLGPEQAGSPGFLALDRTRLTVTVSGLGLDGFTADQILHTELGVTAELPSLQHLTFVISLGNTAEDIDQLVKAFQQLAERFRGGQWSAVSGQRSAVSGQQSAVSGQHPADACNDSMPILAISPQQAFFATTETVAVQQAVNRISAELICPYPPGIPTLMPGEVVTEAAIATLQTVLAAGGQITGCSDPSLQHLRVIRQ